MNRAPKIGAGDRARRMVAAPLLWALLLAVQPAAAQVARTGNSLSLSLAMEAASAAVEACASQGWAVSVSIVDASGNVKLQVKGDHSTVHTKDSSFRKAYTTVTMGPIFGFQSLGTWVKRLEDSPNAPALASLPDILLLADAVAVTIDGETVAAIGVGGAPGGDKDEACAAAGLARIADRLRR